MKRVLLLLALLISGFLLPAQSGSWKIKLHNKTLLSTGTENETKNEKKISSSDWKRSGFFELIFKEQEPGTWYRHYQFVDEQDEVLLSKDSLTKVKIPVADLRRLFKGKKTIKIYTYVSPVDPQLAIRMRKVHLFTLKLP